VRSTSIPIACVALAAALSACDDRAPLAAFVPLCTPEPPRVLPEAWATSFMPLGDSQTSGLTELGAQPDGLPFAVGGDGTGTWRRYLLDEVAALGIPIPQSSWMRGRYESTDPNIPYGQNRHQGVPGYTCANLSDNFASWWRPPLASRSIVLLCGTNDWQEWFASHPGDVEGAAAHAQDSLATLLATIRSVAGPDVTVGVVSPPTGHTHLAEASLFLPRLEATVAQAAAGGQSVRLLCDGTTYLRPPAARVYGLPPRGFMDADDIHLNEVGQRELAHCILHGMLEDSCATEAPPVLPGAWGRSVMPLGDFQTSGSADLGAQPPGIAVSVGADGTGTWRRHLLDELGALHVALPPSWLRGSQRSTDPNIPPEESAHEAIADAQCADLNAAFPLAWTGPAAAQSIIVTCGTNDWQAWLDGHDGDFDGAAAYAQANMAALLATIKSVAGPDVFVGVVSPPTGQRHLQEANRFLPLLQATITDAAAGGQRVYLLCDGTNALQPQPPGTVGLPSAGLMDDDDVHLNELGQRVLAGCILRGMLDSPFR
jgi:lysophospholipase L1-like esterase